MANESKSKRTRGPWLIAALLVWTCVYACGDDDASDTGGGAGAAGSCTPGRTETGCMCNAEQPAGSRHCGEDGVWDLCVCPPRGSNNSCTPGQEVLCFPCPGEKEGRRTTCLGNGTLDCGCRTDGGRPRRDAATENDDAGS